MILYEIIAFVLPGLTRAERRFLGPIVFGSSLLFYAGLAFSYWVLTPAALNFFVNYAEGVVESLWSIDQYFEFVLVLMFSTGLSFQVLYVAVRMFYMYLKHCFTHLHLEFCFLLVYRFRLFSYSWDKLGWFQEIKCCQFGDMWWWVRWLLQLYSRPPQTLSLKCY